MSALCLRILEESVLAKCVTLILFHLFFLHNVTEGTETSLLQPDASCTLQDHLEATCFCLLPIIGKFQESTFISRYMLEAANRVLKEKKLDQFKSFAIPWHHQPARSEA